jgi:PAS domain S-box-containing protein
MSANQFLTFVCQILFAALTIITLVNYIRERSVIRRDIALMFSSLGVPIVIIALLESVGATKSTTNFVASFALLAAPLFLLRLVRHLQPIPPSILRATFIFAIVAWGLELLTILFAPPLSPAVEFAIILYFIVVNIYTMRIFLRGMPSSSGVARQRIYLAALGSGLLALAFVIALVPVFVPILSNLFNGLALVVLALSALAYFFGFTPPRWLRNTWQLRELRSFLLLMTAKPMYERLSVATSVNELCQSAIRAVGGVASAVVRQQTSAREIAAQIGLEGGQLNTVLNAPDGIIEQCFLTAAPLSVCAADAISASDRALLASVSAEMMHASPILTTEGVWGIALVFHRSGALFPEDDLALLNLLTQQSAVFLENSLLVDELRLHSGEMEARVDARTRELKDSREQYRQIVETAQEGIWLTDGMFRTTFVNKKMAEMLATTIEDMLTSPPESFLDKEWLGMIDQLKTRRRAGVGEQYESKLRRRDGGVLWALTSATPLNDENGKLVGSLTMVADITKLKEAEERLLQLNAELEERVASRTADLITLNREMEAFSYSVSHDLRAPLRGIDGFSQALLEDHADQLDDDGRNLLGRVRAAAQRMATLIDDLLNLSRISRSEMKWENIDLTELAHSVIDDLRQSDPAREIEIVIAPEMCVSGDERLIRIALENLLRNAWKFTRKTKDARIEIAPMLEHGTDVYAVRDNGAGFDMAYADKLFGAFQRLHSMSEYEGTGIGLATVQRIIHRHGGRIWAEGAVNEGATFYFTLQVPQPERSVTTDDHDSTR